MSRRKKQQEQCRRKLRHVDYLSALLHARSLADEEIVIYPCTVCGGLHLGHNRPRFTTHCAREGAAEAAALLQKIKRQERIIGDHLRIAHELQRRLDAVIISYDLARPETRDSSSDTRFVSSSDQN